MVKRRNPTRGEQHNDCKSSKTDGPAVASRVGAMWLDSVALVGHAVLSDLGPPFQKVRTPAPHSTGAHDSGQCRDGGVPRRGSLFLGWVVRHNSFSTL